MAYRQKIAAVNKITSATTTSRGSAITLLIISTTIDGRSAWRHCIRNVTRCNPKETWKIEQDVYHSTNSLQFSRTNSQAKHDVHAHTVLFLTWHAQKLKFFKQLWNLFYHPAYVYPIADSLWVFIFTYDVNLIVALVFTFIDSSNWGKPERAPH